MNIIERHATDFVDSTLDRSRYLTPVKIREFVNEVSQESTRYKNQLDRIIFLEATISEIIKQASEHASHCTKPQPCNEIKNYEDILYFLKQDLEYISGSSSDNLFSEQEKEQYRNKIDLLLKQIEELKAGHEIIYEDLIKEIKELKDLFFLGKKHWGQLLVGKATEMVMGGVISETVAKGIVESIKKISPNLLS